MPVKSKNLLLTVTLAFASLTGPARAAGDLATLFTTPEERQLINANRYKSEQVDRQPVSTMEVDESPVQQLVREQFDVDYRISGFSLSADSTPTVWINGQAYLDGEQLDDGSRVDVIRGAETRVRITTPDGKRHYGTSGETLSVSFMAAVED